MVGGRGEKGEEKKGVGVEQITRRDGIYYYGDRPCHSADEAYGRWRTDYHKIVGRAAYHRVDRLGQRTERLHGYGFDFAGPVPVGVLPDSGRIRCQILGLVLVSYCRLIGLWDYGYVSDEEFDGWFDWVFSRGSGALRTVGKRKATGRNSKRLKTRYR